MIIPILMITAVLTVFSYKEANPQPTTKEIVEQEKNIANGSIDRSR